jgi:hypothetical protein
MSATDWTIARHDEMFGLFSHCTGCGRRLATGMAGVLQTPTIAITYYLCARCYETDFPAVAQPLDARYAGNDKDTVWNKPPLLRP